ncbi:hypothetical protein DK867_20640 [Ochrobactrum sp. POC9]|uniref:DUF6880 family protein n=1 Tax=Ochrobactrum sp. POC9 TaxID=2203419 RepID=UPI000D706A94|nr:DUF6880 family protein [Ochrobactrum sp. POC9]PWU71197.1 hypothetical protein DK867_20640 [Ochrobactrum sp. POC9]
MASKTTLNAKNLEALGVERLAALLIEISTGNANHKRRLRMELVGNSSSVELAREVRKRLGSIARAKSWIDWQKVKSVKADLEAQRKTIAEKIAFSDPEEAFELIWQFLSLADTIFERSHDGSGTLIESFHAACDDAGRIAVLAKVSAQRVVDKIVTALQGNGYGQYDGLIDAMAPVLGGTGLRKLQNAFERSAREPKSRIAEADMQRVGWSLNGPVYREELHARGQSITVKVVLQQIADALGDVDLYIAQQSEASKAFATVATEIAKRLLSAERAEEALNALAKAEFDNRHEISSQYQVVRAQTLEALGRTDEAQQFRWNSFEQSLNDELLRAYLQRLPDFDDMEAEEKAFDYVQRFPDASRALSFFIRYPSLPEASKLVLCRASEIDGNQYELLSVGAEKLAQKFPLSASILLRAMIDFTLDGGRSSRYKHAARHLLECGTLARHITDYSAMAPHDVYIGGLRKVHGRKHGFWALFDEPR